MRICGQTIKLTCRIPFTSIYLYAIQKKKKIKPKLTLITWLLRSEPIWFHIIFETWQSLQGYGIINENMLSNCQIDLQDSMH